MCICIDVYRPFVENWFWLLVNISAQNSLPHCRNYIGECLVLCDYGRIFAKEALTREQRGGIQLLNIISLRSTLLKVKWMTEVWASEHAVGTEFLFSVWNILTYDIHIYIYILHIDIDIDIDIDMYLYIYICISFYHGMASNGLVSVPGLWCSTLEALPSKIRGVGAWVASTCVMWEFLFHWLLSLIAYSGE